MPDPESQLDGATLHFIHLPYIVVAKLPEVAILIFWDARLFLDGDIGLARNLSWGGIKLQYSSWNKFSNRSGVIVTT